MSAPNTIIQRRDLSDLVKDYDVNGNSEGFVGLGILPLFNTELQSGNFPKMEVKDLMQNANTQRSNRGAYNRVDFSFGQDNFACTEYGLEIGIDDALAKNYDSYFRAESEGQDIILGILAKNQEIRVKDIVEGQSANAVSTPWSTAATCTPRADVLAGQKAVRDATGMIPKKLTMTWDKFKEILICDEFMDSAKYTSNVLTLGMEAQISIVSAYLGVDDLSLSWGVVDSADEGQAFASSGIWDDTKAFLQLAPTSSLQGGPSFGKTMNWAADEVVNTESYVEPQTRSTILRTRNWRDEKVLLADAGYLLTSL